MTSITKSWRAGREAVAAFALRSAQLGWVFIEVPQQNDFGKDGYVDLTTPEGGIPGNCFAVQIKGGRSRWKSDGYRIDASEVQRSRWAMSTIPVIGIAFDPETGWLHWCDLTGLLTAGGLDAELIAPRTQHLNGEPEVKRFRRYVGATTQSQSSVLDLVSTDVDRQMEAAFVCYFVGREDGRALVLLRRTLFSLTLEAREFAVEQLARAIPHPDIFHTTETMVSMDARETLRASLTWTVEEACELLALVDDEGGLNRGTIGQTVFHLLVEDSNARDLLAQAATAAARAGRMEIAGWGLVIAVHLAEDGQSMLEELLGEVPELRATWAAAQIADMLAEYGEISLF